AAYAPYLERQEGELRDLRASESVRLGPNFPYRQVPGLSNEMVERLTTAQPNDLAAAGRVRGVTPAALAAVLVFARRQATAAWSVPKTRREPSAPHARIATGRPGLSNSPRWLRPSIRSRTSCPLRASARSGSATSRIAHSCSTTFHVKQMALGSILEAERVFPVWC